MEPFFEAVIFDMDGTLLDTERLAWQAWQRAVAEVEVTFPDGFYHSIIGRTRQDYTACIQRAISHPERVESLLAAMPQHYDAVIQHDGMPLRPGVRETLEWLAAKGIPLAVATSTGRAMAVKKLRMAGLDHFFSSVTTGDDVVRGKPEPDIFHEALSRLGCDASKCLVVEDSPNGLRAATAAGLRTVLVPDLAPIPPAVAALAWRQCACIDELCVFLPGCLAASGGGQ